MRERVIGIDFSGSSNAGGKIWIAEGMLQNGAVEITSCRPASCLATDGAKLEGALKALREHVAPQSGSIVGLDFPFGLPACVVRETDWRAFVDDFRTSYGSPDEFRAAMRQLTGGKEPKRATDKEASTPFGCWNLKLYRQTYWGIADVLASLLEQDAVRVLPMQTPNDGKPWLIEICPASTLRKRLKLGISYKEPRVAGDAAHNARRTILQRLVHDGLLLAMAGDVEKIAVETKDGDALDSIIAAVAAAQALRDPNLARPRSRLEAIEGRVFY